MRPLGKLATFTLMLAIPSIAWGNLDLLFADVVLAVGWAAFAVGVLEYYVTAGLYAVDVRRATAGT